MSNITEICNPNKIWTIEEANQILPLVRRICDNCDEECERLLSKQRSLAMYHAPKEQVDAIDGQVTACLIKWNTKLVKLGVVIFGGSYLFNKGNGYFSWLKPETRIEYEIHSQYNPVVSMRRKISDAPGA